MGLSVSYGSGEELDYAGGSATLPQTLTITPAPDPTPTLTFATPTSASVAYGDSLTNAATSDITGPGAGAISYGSTDAGVAIVDETTGAITTIGVGSTVITANQAAAAGVNAGTTATYELTVVPGTGSTSSLTLAANTVAIGEAVDLTVTVTNRTGMSLSGDTGANMVIGTGASGRLTIDATPISNTCGGNTGLQLPIATSLTGISLASNASCQVVFRLRSTGASTGPVTINSVINMGPNNIYIANQGVDLTIEAAPDPTPTLTFATPTSASVAYGGSLTNAATSTISAPDAGAITYSSSDTGVATVDASSGAITTVSAGIATITADQAAAAGVNASATTSYALTVTAGAGSTSDATLSASTAQLGDTVDLTITVTNTSGVDVVAGDNASVAASLITGAINYNTTTGPLSNSCGGSWSQNHIYGQTQSGIAVANGASCTIVYRLTGTGVLSDTITVGLAKGTSNLNNASYSLPLTITAATPTPVLTFATPTSASVAYGGGLTNAATSTITAPGAGAITYSSSDEGVATVDASSGAITIVSVGTTTITATQAAAGGVNVEATTTYALSVTPGAGSTSSAILSTGASLVVGESGDLTITVTNNTGMDLAPSDGSRIVVTMTGPSGQVAFDAGSVSSTCSGIQTVDEADSKSLNGIALANGESCTVVYRLNAISASSAATRLSTEISLIRAGSEFLHIQVPGHYLSIYPPFPVLTFATPTAVNLALGGSLTNAATSTISAPGAGAITYVSSNTNVATVDAGTGAITTLAVGPTTITASQAETETVNSFAAQTYLLTVTPPTPVLTFATPTSASVVYGGALTNMATSSVSGAFSGAITYSSSDTNVATVNATTGAISTVGTGTSTITATQAAGEDVNLEATQTYALTVTAPAAPTITVSTTSFPSTIAVGGTTQLTFTLTNPNPVQITGVAVSLSLPFGLVINQNNGGQFVNNCTNGSLSGSTGGASVSLSGAQINAGSSCTFTVVVRGAASGAPSVSTGTPAATAATPGVAGTPLTLAVNPALTTTQAIASVGLRQDLAVTPFIPVTAAGGVPALHYGLSGPGLPAGLSFSTTTGQITGTPLSPQSRSTYTVTVTDASTPTALTSSKTFDLTVDARPDPAPVLTFTTPGSASVVYGGSLTNAATSTISGGGAGEITYRSSDTSVATVNAITGAVTPVSVGSTTLVATQSAASGVNNQALAVYLLFVTPASMTVSESLSANLVNAGDGFDLTVTVTNTTGRDIVPDDFARIEPMVRGGVAMLALGDPASNSCGGFLAFDNRVHKVIGRLGLARDASCALTFRLVATGTPGMTDVVIVSFRPNSATAPTEHALTLTIATPTPTLTFATPTSASVAYGDSLTNAATSTITAPGAGAITYSSSNTNVATVNSTTGAINTVHVGTVIITATQAAGSANATAAATYSLSVTPGPMLMSENVSASTANVGEGVDLTLTFTNNTGADWTGSDFAQFDLVVSNSAFEIDPGAPASNSCGGTLQLTNASFKRLTSLVVANGASCTVAFHLTAVGAPGATSDLSVFFRPNNTDTASLHTLGVAIATPTPVLTFATPTAASVALGGSMTNAATSTISVVGAGAITYASSNTNVATVNASSGAITTLGVGTATITATQAATAGVNAGATASYELTVTAPPAPTVAAVNANVAYNSAGEAITLLPAGVFTSLDVATGPTNGSVTLSGSTATYVPAAGYFGADSFTYTATGPGGTSSPATVNLTIATPPAPTVGAVSANVAYNSAGEAITLLPSGVFTSLAVATAPTNGSVTPSGSTATYVPTPGYFGPDSFTYTATGPGGTSAAATVSLTVATPAAPTVGAVNANVAYNSAGQAVTLLPAGVFTSLAVATGPTNGSVTLSGSTATYTPTTGSFGPDSFTYTATGPGGTSSPATVSLTVATPAAPTVSKVDANVPYNSAGEAITLEPAGVFTSLAVATGPTNGSVTLSGSTATYTPTPGYFGPDTFTYTATGPGGTSAAATASLTVATPAAPTAAAVNANVPYNSAGQAITLLPAGVFTSLAVATAPTNGSVTISGSTATYTPTTGSFGPDSFTYTATGPGGTSAAATVSLTVATPAAPTVSAVNANVAYNSAGQAVTLLPAGVFTSLAVATAPTNGSVTISGSTATYTPTPGSFGPDSFTYTATGPGGTSAAATVSLTVATPPAPTVSAVNANVAYNSAGEPITLLPSGVFTSLAVATAPTNGSVTLSGSTATYVPAAGYFGSDSFTYTATGPGGTSAAATVSLTVATPSAPTAGAVSANVAYNSAGQAITLLPAGVFTSLAVATAPTNGSVTLSGSTATYTPTPGYFGPDSFTYTATGPGGTSAAATVSLTVATPPAPTAGAVSANVAYNSAGQAVTLLPTGVFTSLAVATAPANGSVTLSGSTATYVPAPGFFGSDSFTYTATGPGGTSAAATVSLTVATPPAPTVGAVNANVAYNSAGEAITLLPAGVFTSLDVATAPANGSVTISGTTATYVPTTGSFGPDSFSYTATGPGGTSAAATVNLTVATPPAPLAEAVAVSVDVSTDETGGSASIDLSSAVSNAVGIMIVTPPLHGTVTVSGFVVTYTPDPGYFGPDSFTYRAVGLPGSSASSAPAALAGSSSRRSLSAPSPLGAPAVSNLAMVSISVSPPTLTMSPAAAEPASVGIAFSQTFAASGGTGPYHDYRVADGALPAGLTLSSDGRLTGAPTAGGTFGFTIVATDSSTGSGPFTASRVYSLAVSAPTMSLSPAVLSDGIQGEAYTPVAFAGQGGTAPYSFSLTSGALPTGLTLSNTGQLSGTPIQSGDFSFTVRAIDASTGSGPFTSERALTLTIGVPAAPTASAAALDAPFNSAGVEIDVATLVSGPYSDVALAAGPAHGSLVRLGTRFTYTPTSGYYGPDSFSYRATGYGGTSAPAVIAVTVATPAPVTTPKSATTLANASVDVAVTTGDRGPISSIAITQAPAHGVAVINGLVVAYTPTTNYFGADSFSYTATGDGGTSAPAVVSLTVSPLPVPSASARTASVVSGQSVTLDATDGAAGGPFTGVTIVDPPAKGIAMVSGQQITYAAPPTFSGTTSFTYGLNNPFGTSTPIMVTITVNPMPVTSGPITVTVPADGSGSASLTTDAAGGPFRSAAIVSLTPAGSGTVAISEGSSPSGPTFTLTFVAATHFSGPATVSYTLSNAFATSAPGTVIFQVQARADPTLDPDVRGLVAAQTDAVMRFATAQMSNFNQRLESLRAGPGRSDLTGATFNFGDLIHRGDESDPFALRDRQLGRQEADVAAWGIRPTAPADKATGFHAAGDGGSGGDDEAGISLWTGGTIDMGLRRSRAGLSRLDFTTQGVSVGADFSLNDQMVIGAGTGYSSDSTSIGTDGSRSRATSYVGVLYGAYHPADQTYLEMVLGYGEMTFESRRFVPVNGLTAYGERDGRQLFASLTAAFEQRDGPLVWTPYGRVAVVAAELDAFTETGGGVGGLTFHGQDIRSVKGVAGLTSTYVARTLYGLLTPALRLEYAYEFEDVGTYSLNWADWVGGPVFTARADALGRGRLTIGVGADLQRGPVLFGLEYRGGVGSDNATTSQINARMTMKF
ncbi:MAG: hypothetical protein K9G59_15710 [Caulobacter sp.]|nr:hypothetical protein [Caulobacter sp.]